MTRTLVSALALCPLHAARAMQAADDAPAHSVNAPLDVLVRWATFSGLLLVIGAVIFERLVLRALRARGSPNNVTLARRARARAAGGGLAASVVLLAAVLARLGTQLLSMSDMPVPVGVVIADTAWGHGWLLQCVAALAALGGFILARRAVPGGWALATVAAAALAVAPALTGHAAAMTHRTGLAIAADALHVIAASGWLGTLAWIVLAGLPASRALGGGAAQGVADLVNAFSPRALVFGSLLLLSGITSAWLRLGGVAALFSSDYGRTLLVKLALLVPLALTGAYNWRVMRPALGTAGATPKLRRTASIELAFSLLVVAVTAVLVGTATPE